MTIAELFVKFRCDEQEQVVLLEFLRSLRINRIIQEIDEIKHTLNL